MFKLILESVHTGEASHVGGPVVTHFRTFDFQCAEAEEFLAKFDGCVWDYVQIVGVERVDEAARERREVGSERATK